MKKCNYASGRSRLLNGQSAERDRDRERERKGGEDGEVKEKKRVLHMPRDERWVNKWERGSHWPLGQGSLHLQLPIITLLPWERAKDRLGCVITSLLAFSLSFAFACTLFFSSSSLAASLFFRFLWCANLYRHHTQLLASDYCFLSLLVRQPLATCLAHRTLPIMSVSSCLAAKSGSHCDHRQTSIGFSSLFLFSFHLTHLLFSSLYYTPWHLVR